MLICSMRPGQSFTLTQPNRLLGGISFVYCLDIVEATFLGESRFRHMAVYLMLFTPIASIARMLSEGMMRKKIASHYSNDAHARFRISLTLPK